MSVNRKLVSLEFAEEHLAKNFPPDFSELRINGEPIQLPSWDKNFLEFNAANHTYSAKLNDEKSIIVN